MSSKPTSATPSEQRGAVLFFHQGTTDLRLARCQNLAELSVSTIHWAEMLALSEFSLAGTAALVTALAAALFWRPLFSREARDRRRREHSYRKVSRRRQQATVVQLNIETPKAERGRNRQSSS